MSDGSVSHGRRRITQLTKDEWKEELQRQMMEKQQKQSQEKQEKMLRRALEREDILVPTNQDSHDTTTESYSICKNVGNIRSGRGLVRPMTNEEWRASLENQIREKQNDSRSQTTTPNPASSSTTEIGCTSLANTEPIVRGRMRRKPLSAVSQEEYLRQLKEQIEERKKLNQQKNSIDDNDVTPSTTRATEASSLEEPQLNGESHTREQINVPESTTDISHSGVDNTAWTRLLEFCEEVKQQNEDLKRQMSEQHAVLSSLVSKTANVNENRETSKSNESQSSKAKDKTEKKSNVNANKKEKKSGKDIHRPRGSSIEDREKEQKEVSTIQPPIRKVTTERQRATAQSTIDGKSKITPMRGIRRPQAVEPAVKKKEIEHCHQSKPTSESTVEVESQTKQSSLGTLSAELLPKISVSKSPQPSSSPISRDSSRNELPALTTTNRTASRSASAMCMKEGNDCLDAESGSMLEWHTSSDLLLRGSSRMMFIN